MEREPASTLNQQYLSAILSGAPDIYTLCLPAEILCARHRKDGIIVDSTNSYV